MSIITQIFISITTCLSVESSYLDYKGGNSTVEHMFYYFYRQNTIISTLSLRRKIKFQWMYFNYDSVINIEQNLSRTYVAMFVLIE